MNNDDRIINEILQDFTYLYLLILIELNMDDNEYIGLLDFLNVFLLSIFGHELIEAKIYDESYFNKDDIKFLYQIRTLYLKDEPKKDSELITDLNKQTGLNLCSNDMDIVITKDLFTNKLVSLNYPYFVYPSIPEEDKKRMYAIKRFPAAVLTAASDVIDADFKTIDEELHKIAKAAVCSIKEKTNLKQYSYCSLDLFHDSDIEDSDKYYILYRYPFVSIALLLDAIQPIQIKIEKGLLFQINTSVTSLKIKSMVIEMLYRDDKQLHLPITNIIMTEVNKDIPEEFYRINRKLRNNLHYKHTDSVTNDEYGIIKEYQDIYLEKVLKIMSTNIDSTIRFKNKFYTALSKLLNN